MLTVAACRHRPVSDGLIDALIGRLTDGLIMRAFQPYRLSATTPLQIKGRRNDGHSNLLYNRLCSIYTLQSVVLPALAHTVVAATVSCARQAAHSSTTSGASSSSLC